MADKNTLLILRLEGSLQSWGEDAKWDFRDSASMPTKSGIVGLLGCALGLERGDPELKELSDAVTIAVRADRPGVRAVDFQTVTGDPLMAASGKPKSTGNTIISSRAYLQDACFTVFLQMDAQWRSRITAALRNPRWCMYLGRKNCVPSRPVLECEDPEYTSLGEAIIHYPAAARADDVMPYETEVPIPDRAGYQRPDKLAGGDREFALRRVWRGIVRREANVSDQS